MVNKNESYQDKLIEKIRENYLSIALGLLVLLVAVSIVFRANDSMTTKKNQEAEQQAKEEQLAQGQEYVVKKGDSVSSIARDQLGSMDYTKAIVDENKLMNPEKIEVGQKLVLPRVSIKATGDEKIAGEQTDEQTGEQVSESNPAKVVTSAPTGAITGKTYTVQKGDTLFNITVRAYNNSTMMYKVMHANKIWNPNYIEAGMTLQLPR